MGEPSKEALELARELWSYYGGERQTAAALQKLMDERDNWRRQCFERYSADQFQDLKLRAEAAEEELARLKGRK